MLAPDFDPKCILLPQWFCLYVSEKDNLFFMRWSCLVSFSRRQTHAHEASAGIFKAAHLYIHLRTADFGHNSNHNAGTRRAAHAPFLRMLLLAAVYNYSKHVLSQHHSTPTYNEFFQWYPRPTIISFRESSAPTSHRLQANRRTTCGNWTLQHSSNRDMCQR